MATTLQNFAINGGVLNGAYERWVTADAGSFALSGQSVAVRAARFLGCDPGVFSLTGEDISLRADHRMEVEAGLFELFGQDANLMQLAYALERNIRVPSDDRRFVVEKQTALSDVVEDRYFTIPRESRQFTIRGSA